MGIYLEDVPNKFGLLVPKPYWLKPIEDYDPDLRIFPSQTQGCYRLMRVAHHSGPMAGKVFEGITEGIHPDTLVAIKYGLVAVTTIPPMALSAPPHNIVQQLRERDQWVLGGGRDAAAGDRIADLLDQRDTTNRAALEREVHNDGLLIHESARVSLLYRTGARVSLVKPPTWRGKNREQVTSPSGDAQSSTSTTGTSTP